MEVDDGRWGRKPETCDALFRRVDEELKRFERLIAEVRASRVQLQLMSKEPLRQMRFFFV